MAGRGRAAARARDIRLQNPALASLTGKGRKTRHVPLAGNTITLLAAYQSPPYFCRPESARPQRIPDLAQERLDPDPGLDHG